MQMFYRTCIAFPLQSWERRVLKGAQRLENPHLNYARVRVIFVKLMAVSHGHRGGLECPRALLVKWENSLWSTAKLRISV